MYCRCGHYKFVKQLRSKTSFIFQHDWFDQNFFHDLDYFDNVSKCY